MTRLIHERRKQREKERENDQVRGRNKCSSLLVPWCPNYRTFPTAPRYVVSYCVRRSITAAAAFKGARKLWKAAFGKKRNF
jgi:hypothetical protein